MTHQDSSTYAPGLADAGGQVARLRQVLALVEEVAGERASAPSDAELDEGARISIGYARAWPIEQKRFDALAAETARCAAAGVGALLALEDRNRPCRPAATRLAGELSRSLRRLCELLPA